MRYPGGKGKAYQRIINLMPPHDTYVEAFVGGGAVLRHKHPAKRTVAIDIDPAVIARWQESQPGLATFICADAIELIPGLGLSPNTVVYADPPYLPSTRASQICPYKFDLSEHGHVRLLELLKGLNCAVLISGYRTHLYDTVLADWHSTDYTAVTRRGGRTETLWFNFDPKPELHDYRHLGDGFRERERIKRMGRRWADRLAALPATERRAVLMHVADRCPEDLASALTASRCVQEAAGDD